ncbi:MAG: hypothetical protein MN733_17905, partial [Nitrososphaera sp.]|nr:hypothetical protein [Nitrososphaera sp.]
DEGSLKQLTQDEREEQLEYLWNVIIGEQNNAMGMLWSPVEAELQDYFATNMRDDRVVFHLWYRLRDALRTLDTARREVYGEATARITEATKDLMEHLEKRHPTAVTEVTEKLQAIRDLQRSQVTAAMLEQARTAMHETYSKVNEGLRENRKLVIRFGKSLSDLQDGRIDALWNKLRSTLTQRNALLGELASTLDEDLTALDAQAKKLQPKPEALPDIKAEAALQQRTIRDRAQDRIAQTTQEMKDIVERWRPLIAQAEETLRAELQALSAARAQTLQQDMTAVLTADASLMGTILAKNRTIEFYHDALAIAGNIEASRTAWLSMIDALKDAYEEAYPRVHGRRFIGWEPQEYFNSRAVEAVRQPGVSELPELTKGVQVVRAPDPRRDHNLPPGTQLVLETHLEGGHFSKTQGEILLDLRMLPQAIDHRDGSESISRLTLPMNMIGKQFRAKVWVPRELVSLDRQNLNGLQLFVKDRFFLNQYGPYLNIVSGGNWVEVTIAPSLTEFQGFTDPGFDPAQGAVVGLKIALG